MDMHMGSAGGVLQIVDTPHAVAKDCRSLFALDNLKWQSRSKSKSKLDHNQLQVPYPINYYGDITGPCELMLMNRASDKINKLVHDDLDLEYERNISRERHFKSSTASHQHPRLLQSESFSFSSNQYKYALQSPLNILHISHYSFEWALQVNDTIFTDDVGDDEATNYYLIGAYQRTEYTKDTRTEFITMGITKNIPYGDQYRFYVDDFVTDLMKIETNLPWVHKHQCSLGSDIYLLIVQFTVDCVLPVQYNGEDRGDDICLDDEGAMHLILTGEMKERFQHSPVDIKPIGKIFAKFGRIIFDEYKNKRSKLKNEYNEWKKQYNKRKSPKTIKELKKKLNAEMDKRFAKRVELKKMKSLYFDNPNFKVKASKNKHIYSATTMTTSLKQSRSTPKMDDGDNGSFSLKKLFGFGSSKKAKSNQTLTIDVDTDDTKSKSEYSQKSNDGTPLSIHKSNTEPMDNKKSPTKRKQKKKKKKRNRKKNAYDNYDADEHTTPTSTAKYNHKHDHHNAMDFDHEKKYGKLDNNGFAKSKSERTSDINVRRPPLNKASSGSISSVSQGGTRRYRHHFAHPNQNDNKQYMKYEKRERTDTGSKNNYLSADDDPYLPDATLGVTQSADIFMYSSNNIKHGELQAKLTAPSVDRDYENKYDDDVTNQYEKPSPRAHKSVLGYSHDENNMIMLDNYATSNNPIDLDDTERSHLHKARHRKQESIAMLRTKDEIRKMYKLYEIEKNKVPTEVQDFLIYCNRKKIKNANWTYCKEVMEEMSDEEMDAILNDDDFVSDGKREKNDDNQMIILDGYAKSNNAKSMDDVNVTPITTGNDDHLLYENMLLQQISDLLAKNNWKAISCPTYHQQQESANHGNDGNRNNDNQNNPNDQNPQDNDKKDEYDNPDGNGDGDDRKGDDANNDQQEENLTRQQLLKIIEQQRQTIQQQRSMLQQLQSSHQVFVQNLQQIIEQQQYRIYQQQSSYSQQQSVINILQGSHQSLIQNCDNSGKLMISLSNQLRRENQRLHGENEKLKSTHNKQQKRISSETQRKHKKRKKKNQKKGGDLYLYRPSQEIRASIPKSFITKIRATTNMNYEKIKCHLNHNKDKCSCDPLWSWMDIDIAMQFNDNDNNIDTNTRICNHGFIDKQTKNALYCVIESSKGDETGKDDEQGQDAGDNDLKMKNKWQMKEVLYTKKALMEEYKLNEYQLPDPVRISSHFTTQLMQKEAIRSFLIHKNKMDKIISSTNWCKIKVFSKSNGKRRTTLFITQSDLKWNLINDNTFNPEESGLIPIVLFSNQSWHIHYLIMVKIDHSNIGISIIYDNSAQCVKITGIHVDKRSIYNQHQWISLFHLDECKCLNNFKTNINHLRIGNIDEDANKIKDLNARNEKLKQEIDELRDEVVQLRQLKGKEDETPSPSSSDVRYSNGQYDDC